MEEDEAGETETEEGAGQIEEESAKKEMKQSTLEL
jgi:hypothetical protein